MNTLARALLVAVVVTLLGACGGGSSDSSTPSADRAGSAARTEVPPTAWTVDVCSKVTTWLDDLAKRASEIGTEPARQDNLERSRQRFVQLLGDAAAGTDRLLTSVDAAGKPAVEKGEAVSRDLRGSIERVRTSFADAQGRARSLPVDDLGRFQSAARDVLNGVLRAGEDLEATLKGLDEKHDAPELGTAFTTEPACSKLRE